MTLIEMRTMVRRDLHDENENTYRWSDAELDMHIAHAVKELSESIPSEQTVIMTTINGSREIDISAIAGMVMVRAVEFPLQRFPKNYQRFSVWGDTLTLLGDEVPDGSGACIYYCKLHTMDSEGSTIPSFLEELVAAGACGYAAVEWAAFAINRVNTGGISTQQEFLSRGQAKLDFFRKEIKRLGRRNRIRINRLYEPYNPPASKTTEH
jgi:hypothetical protein